MSFGGNRPCFFLGTPWSRDVSQCTKEIVSKHTVFVTGVNRFSGGTRGEGQDSEQQERWSIYSIVSTSSLHALVNVCL